MYKDPEICTQHLKQVLEIRRIIQPEPTQTSESTIEHLPSEQ